MWRRSDFPQGDHEQGKIYRSRKPSQSFRKGEAPLKEEDRLEKKEQNLTHRLAEEYLLAIEKRDLVQKTADAS